MNEKKVTRNVMIENAKLIFRNFRGEGSVYNTPGSRNFGVLLDDKLAESMKADGWNVKYRPPREDDPKQHAQAWLSVNVRFNPYPPIVVLITSRGKIRLTEETVDQLDWSWILNCDLTIHPHNYPARAGRPAGISAYLKAMYVTIQEDYLEEKYADLPFIMENPYDVSKSYYNKEN